MAFLSDEARRDIVNQFDLPERRSKIYSLFKEADQKQCICGSSDSTRFMVGCDGCDNWFHGECVNITEKEAKSIDRYFCPKCVDSMPSLKPVKRTPKKKTASANVSRPSPKSAEKKGNTKNKKPPPGRPTPTMKAEIKSKPVAWKNDRLQYSSSGSDASFSWTDSASEDERGWKPEPNMVGKQRYANRAPPLGKPKPPRKVVTKKGLMKGNHSAMKGFTKSNHIAKRKIFSDSKSNFEAPEESLPKQCYGPDCTNAARPDSKYCCDDCGIRLAHARICQILPGRLVAYNLKLSIAEDHNRRDLSDAREKYTHATKELKRLLLEIKILEKHIQLVQTMEVSWDAVQEDHDGDGTIFCVTCGYEVPLKSGLKHLEKCYNKHEGRTSFGSMHKTNIEGPPLFCDFFHPPTKLYCKRLKVLCMEHTKEPTVTELQICGCPLVDNIEEASNNFCKVGKKKCNKHLGWEKLRRAMIDMDRVNQYLRMDETLEEQAELKSALTSRASVMDLLMNSTFDHDHQTMMHMQREHAYQAALACRSPPEESSSKSPTDPVSI